MVLSSPFLLAHIGNHPLSPLFLCHRGLLNGMQPLFVTWPFQGTTCSIKNLSNKAAMAATEPCFWKAARMGLGGSDCKTPLQWVQGDQTLSGSLKVGQTGAGLFPLLELLSLELARLDVPACLTGRDKGPNFTASVAATKSETKLWSTNAIPRRLSARSSCWLSHKT